MTDIRSVAFATSGGASSISVSAPSGATAGDVVVVLVAANNVVTFADNNGSTPFTEDIDGVQETGGGVSGAVYSRRLQGGDPASYSFTVSTTGRISALAICIQDPDPTDIWDVAPSISTVVAQGAATSHATPSITTLTDNAIHISGVAPDGASTTSSGTPSGYTVQNNSGSQCLSVGTKTISPAGATGAQTWTQGSLQGAIVYSLAIKAAAGGGGGGGASFMLLTGGVG